MGGLGTLEESIIYMYFGDPEEVRGRHKICQQSRVTIINIVKEELFGYTGDLRRAELSRFPG